MKTSTIVIGGIVLVFAVTATPWVIGWQVERLVRARAVQVEGDKNSTIRLRVDSYDRGWRSANARISVIDHQGALLVTLPIAIRHWPFASDGPADWVAVPELGAGAREMLGRWGEKLPEVTTRTQLTWSGDMLAKVESAAFKRGMPDVTAGTLEVAAVTGKLDWRRDGSLSYDLALPLLRMEGHVLGDAKNSAVAEFKETRLTGEGALGAAERRWNQQGSLTAASISMVENGITTLTAATPAITFASREDGAFVDMQFTITASAINVKNDLQNLTDAATEFSFAVHHLDKEPLGRLFDTSAKTMDRVMAEPPSRRRLHAPNIDSPAMDIAHDLLRGSPSIDVRYALKASEGRFEIKLAAAFDGQGYDRNEGMEAWLRRSSVEINARASTSLVIKGAQTATRAVTGMQDMPRTKDGSGALDMSPPADPESVAQQQLREAEARGWIRVEHDEIAATVVWRDGHLTINGKAADTLPDLKRGLTRH